MCFSHSRRLLMVSWHNNYSFPFFIVCHISKKCQQSSQQRWHNYMKMKLLSCLSYLIASNAFNFYFLFSFNYNFLYSSFLVLLVFINISHIWLSIFSLLSYKHFCSPIMQNYGFGLALPYCNIHSFLSSLRKILFSMSYSIACCIFEGIPQKP